MPSGVLLIGRLVSSCVHPRLVVQFHQIVALQLAQFKGFQKEVERIAGKRMRHPACPVVFSTQERPHLLRECMPGCHLHQRIIEGAEHPLTTPICSMQNPMSKEMPWVCPGLSKNFIQLFLLLGLTRIHLSMHGGHQADTHIDPSE